MIWPNPVLLTSLKQTLNKGTAETLTAGVTLETLAGLLPHSLAVFIQPKVAGLPP